MSPVCRAIAKGSKMRAIGYCHNAYYDFQYFGRLLNIPWQEFEPTIAGTNHCGWLLSLKHKGMDVYPALAAKLEESAIEPKELFAYELFKLTGVYPIGGSRHLLEFYPHVRTFEVGKPLPYGQIRRREMIERNQLQRELNKDAHRLRDKADGKVEINVEREGSPEAMGHQIAALSCGPSITHFVNIPNCGAIPNLPPWAVVEVKAAIGGKAAAPVFAGELPVQCARWTLPQLYAHELTVDAALERSREKAIMALASDPMIRDFHEARKVFDALVEAHGDRLKDFRA
jgi:alpha-galactosidase